MRLLFFRENPIVAKAVQLSDTERGAIYVFDELEQLFRLQTTYGFSEDLVAAVQDQHLGASKCVPPGDAGETAAGDCRYTRRAAEPGPRDRDAGRVPGAPRRAAGRHRLRRRGARDPAQATGQ